MITPHPGHGIWFESVIADETDTTWYAYYHDELPAYVCGRPDRSIPRIGAAVSIDRGVTWQNLGIILEAPPGSEVCSSTNRYVIGGVGDVSVMVDRDWKDVYLYFSNYGRDPATQGVLVARFPWADRDAPRGRVTVWAGRRVASTGCQAAHRDRRGAHRVGLSRRHADVRRRARGTTARQRPMRSGDLHCTGIPHCSSTSCCSIAPKTNPSPTTGFTFRSRQRSTIPRAWSTPRKILSGGGWYPQVAGLEPGSGTDREMGRRGRFLVTGRSTRFIEFR